MGNSDSRTQAQNVKKDPENLVTLFKKLQGTGTPHPNELDRSAFEHAFQGPLHSFGRMLCNHMMMVGGSATNQEKVTLEQFISFSREILHLDRVEQVVGYYFHMFAGGKNHLSRDDADLMFEMCFVLALSMSKILYRKDERDPSVLRAMTSGMYGTKSSVGVDDFSKWLNQSCPLLLQPVHSWMVLFLTGSAVPQEMEAASVPQLEDFVGSSSLTSLAVLWLLSISLPPVYIRSPATADGGATASGVSLASSKSKATDTSWVLSLFYSRTARLPHIEGWTQLYNSCDHGMSVNRFSSHVSSYKAPTVMFISCEGGHLYCLALDHSWLEGPKKFGGADCMLLQLLPEYSIVQVGEKMVRWNETLRDVPKGISVGRDGRPEALRLSQDFDKVVRYSVEYGINIIEVWGCGSDSTLQAQKSQKDWERKAVQRENARKLRPEVIGEDWRDGPDKQILQWGGVNVGNHESSNQ